MSVSSDPEILRVHLGQAVLKLAELGISCLTYDFVESPSEEALETAVSTLRELGALDKDKITDTGKWISKLPFDPRNGLLVYLRHVNDLLYECVIISSLLSNSSDIFYRGFTPEDEQKSASNKAQFASPLGDVFTWLEVFKIWSALPRKQQSGWCQKNSVNSKVMNLTAKSIKEVSDTLRKEQGISLREQFSSSETLSEALRKLIFQANHSMVGMYLGHRRAGYHAVGLQRQVHMHPSSTLMSQNAQPMWVVYADFIKTSRDFIKGITVVEESWVKEAIERGEFNIDIDEIKSKQVKLVHQEEAGRSVFRALVGPRFQNLSALEETLIEYGFKTVIVEADRNLGTLEIYSDSSPNAHLEQLLDSYSKPAVCNLQNQEKEIPLSKKHAGCHVIIGEGGSINNVLMLGQSTKVFIKDTPYSFSVEDVKAKFSVYGEVKECFRVKSEDPWGIVRFASCEEAEDAAFDTEDDTTCRAVLCKSKSRGRQTSGQFEARITWCRRPIKEPGTAFITCPYMYHEYLIGDTIATVDETSIIKKSRKGEDLICHKTGSTNEDDIKSQVIDLIRSHVSHKRVDLEKQIRVSLIREHRDCPTEEEYGDIQTQIAEKFNKLLDVPQDTCIVDLKPVKRGTFNHVGFVRFNNPITGYRACHYRMRHPFFVHGQPVEINPQLKTSIQIPGRIMKVCQERFDDLIAGLKKYKSTIVNVTKMQRGDFRLDICSQQPMCIVESLVLFQTELEGEVIECGNSELLENIFKPPGVEAVKKIEKSGNALIVVDQRAKKLHIYGSSKEVSLAQIEVNKYLGRLVDGQEEILYLKGSKRPPGLMKALLLEYGLTLEELKTAYGLGNIKIDFKLQKLSLIGKPNALTECIASIEDLSTKLEERFSMQIDTSLPECVVCMCPVETSSELYRLEHCGHAYCNTCLEMQAKVSIDDKQFPVTCAKEECDKKLVWRDFDFFLQKKWIEEDKLVQMSVNAFVEQNPNTFKFCSTPNCPMLYRATVTQHGGVFVCPMCQARVCSSCASPAHPGITCHMAKSTSGAEQELEQWSKEDPRRRQVCPGCRIPIEKIEGCNKMTCGNCRTVFCWLCQQTFRNTTECYAHLSTKHGGVFDVQ